MYDKLIIATLLFILGQTITWFSSYSQFVWEWAAARPAFFGVVMAIPAALCFIYGVKYAYEFFETGWGPRFYIFSLSFGIFRHLLKHSLLIFFKFLGILIARISVFQIFQNLLCVRRDSPLR